MSSSPCGTAPARRWVSSGVAPAPILKGDKGDRAGPTAWWAASPTATGFRGAVGRPPGDVRSVGIDAEPHESCPRACWTRSACPRNAPSCIALHAGLHWDRILFCAKEATYKAWFPLTHRWLGFEDAHITFASTPPAGGHLRVADTDRSDR